MEEKFLLFQQLEIYFSFTETVRASHTIIDLLSVIQHLYVLLTADVVYEKRHMV